MPRILFSAESKGLRWLLLFILFYLLSGCAVKLARPFDKGIAPNKQKSYVYGRFALNNSANEIALRIQETKWNGEVYNIAFYNSLRHYVVEVKPGKYYIGKISYIKDTGTESGEHPITEESPAAEFQLEPGKIYYLGDYLGSSSREFTGNFINYKWRLQSIQDNFNNSTEIIKTMYPSFQENFETVNLMEKLSGLIIRRSEQPDDEW